MPENFDTICAPITANVSAPIGVVRISGEKALEIAKEIFSKPDKIEKNKVVYGKIIYNGELIDTCLLSYFKAPNSYTGEDIIELSCHGSLSVIDALIKVIISLGGRKALPGEFTKRAFLNGKMDLTQAESVMELIDAQTQAERKAATAHMGGATFNLIEDIRNDLLDISANLSAFVDYPDEEIEQLKEDSLKTTLLSCIEKVKNMLDRAEKGQFVKEGIVTAILGKTNAGKSSIMNMLSGKRKSIVTDMEGTTRDVVENTISLNGVKLILSDTAGLRQTDNQAEKIGIDMSIELAKTSSLNLCVFDLSRPLSKEDFDLEELTRNTKRIGIFNKTDLENKADAKKLLDLFENKVYTSVLNNNGFDVLANTINEMFLKGLPSDGNLIMSTRQFSQLKIMETELSEALNALNLGLTLDAVGICIDGAINAAGEITGRTVTEDTVARIFERFCVGK